MSLRLAIEKVSKSLAAVEMAIATSAADERVRTTVIEHQREFFAFLSVVDDLRKTLILAQHRVFGRSSEKRVHETTVEPTTTQAEDVLGLLFQFLDSNAVPFASADPPELKQAQEASAAVQESPSTNVAELADLEQKSSSPDDATSVLSCGITECQPLIECASTLECDDQIAKDDVSSNTRAQKPAQDPSKPNNWRGPWFLHLSPESIEPTTATDCCPECGGSTRCIDHVVTEILRWIPGRISRRRVVRRKSVCAGTCQRFTVSPWPEHIEAPLIERSLPDASLVAKLIVDHVRFAIPIYRQQEMIRVGEARIPYNTMLRWRAMGSQLLLPVYDGLHQWAQQTSHGQIDDTRLMALKPDSDEQDKHTIAGRMWNFTDNATFVYCDYAENWKASFLETIIGDFTGVLLGDGYAGYARFCEEHQLAGLAGCNEHSRRKFCDAALVHDPIALNIVEDFAKIYAVERHAKREKIVGEELVALRQRQSKPVFASIRAKLLKASQDHTLGAPLRRAVTYFLLQYDRLTLYLSDAKLPIGNNDLERMIRKIAMIRKASLFVGSVESGKNLAINLSIVLTCELCKICPYEYLCDVLPKLAGTDFPASRRDELLPHNWAKARAFATQTPSAA